MGSWYSRLLRRWLVSYWKLLWSESKDQMIGRRKPPKKWDFCQREQCVPSSDNGSPERHHKSSKIIWPDGSAEESTKVTCYKLRQNSVHDRPLVAKSECFSATEGDVQKKTSPRVLLIQFWLSQRKRNKRKEKEKKVWKRTLLTWIKLIIVKIIQSSLMLLLWRWIDLSEKKKQRNQANCYSRDAG